MSINKNRVKHYFLVEISRSLMMFVSPLDFAIDSNHKTFLDGHRPDLLILKIKTSLWGDNSLSLATIFVDEATCTAG